MKLTQRGNFVETLEARQMFAYTGTWASTSQPSVTKTIYVSAGASVKTLAAAVAASGDNTQILFKRGETFNTVGVTESNNNIIFGAYGTGADPILAGANSSAATSTILGIKGSNVWVESIKFTDKDTNTNFTAVSALGSHGLTVTNCTAETSLYNFVYGSKTSVGTTVSHSEAPEGLNAYFVYTALGSKYLDVNNNYMNHSRTEHGIRIHTNDFRVTENKVIQRPTSNRRFKSALCVREGGDGYIAHNYFEGAQVTILGPLAARKTATLKDVVYEYNTCVNAKQFQIFEGASGIVIRHNSIQKAGGTGTVFSIQASNTNRPGPEVTFEDNDLWGDNLISGDTSDSTFSENTLY
jgi:hypothetical protein